MSDEEWSDDESYASCEFAVHDADEDEDAKQRWTPLSEPINVVAARWVYVQTKLLESMFNQVSAPKQQQPCFYHYVWSPIDPMRALVRVASVANAYYMMTKRDMVHDDRIGHYNRFHTLSDHPYCCFEHLRNQYQPGLLKQEPGQLCKWMAPICFAVDEKTIAVRELKRTAKHGPHILFAIESYRLPLLGGSQHKAALKAILKQNPSFSHLWNSVSYQDGVSIASVAALSRRLFALAPRRPQSIAPHGDSDNGAVCGFSERRGSF